MRRAYLSAFMVLFFTALECPIANAQEPCLDAGLGSALELIRWESMGGPPGGNHGYFAQDPYRPSNVYLSTLRGLYRSVNKGENWSLFWQGAHGGVAFTEEVIFLCTPMGLVRTVNGTFEDEPVYSRSGCRDVFVTSEKIFLSVDSETLLNKPDYLQVFVANLDSPETWTDVSPSKDIIESVFASYIEEGQLTAVAAATQVLASETGWLMLLAAIYGPKFESRLLISQNEGSSWSPVDPGLAQPLRVLKVVQDPGDGEHYVLIARAVGADPEFRPLKEFVYESLDGGQTWSPATDVADVLTPRIADVDIVGDSYFLTDVDASIVELIGPAHGSYNRYPTPSVADYSFGYRVEELYFDVSDGNVVWGRGWLGWDGVIRTDDTFGSWRRVVDGVIASPAPNITVHPEDPEVVVASGNLGYLPHMTRDGGSSWSPLVGTSMMADEVAFNPHDPDQLLMVSEQTAFQESNDGGTEWHSLASQFGGNRVYDFEVSTEGEGVVYASNLGSNVTRLNHANRVLDPTFEVVWENLLFSPDYAYDLELQPSDPNVLFASYSPKIFEKHASVWKYDANQAANGGWSEVLRLEGARGVTSVEIDPSETETIYAGETGERGRIHVSRNGGSSWEVLHPESNFSFVTIHELTVDPTNEATVWAAPWGGGLFRSIDHGATWSEMDAPTRSIASIVIDSNDSTHLRLADRTSPTVWETTDGGTTWHPVVNLDGDEYQRIMSMRADGEQLYFSALRRLRGRPPELSGTAFRLDDNGLAPLEGLDQSVLSFFPTTGGLYAVTHYRGVYKYEENAWYSISQGLPDMGFFSTIVDEGGAVYVAGGSDIDITTVNRRVGDDNLVHQIYRSADDGQNWEPLLVNDPFQSPVKKLLQHPVNKEVLLAATSNGLFLSRNRGQSWEPQNVGLGFLNIGSVAMSENYVYAGTLGGGVWTGQFDSEGNLNWTPSAGPYPEIYNLQIHVDPEHSNTIYASAYPGGVFKTTDGGATWTEINFAMPSFAVVDPTQQGYYSLEIDPSDSKRLFLGTFGRGVFRSTNGGATWLPLHSATEGGPEIMRKGIRKVAIDPTESDDVYVATDDGLYVSPNGGDTWAEMNHAGMDTRDILCVRVTGGKLYVSTNGYGMYAFDPDKERWRHLGHTTSSGEWHVWDRRLYQYSSLLFAPEDPDKVYLGHFPSGFYVSYDRGQTWKFQSLGLGNDGMFSLAVHPEAPNVLFAGTYNGIVRSDDFGHTWRQTSEGLPPEQWPFAVVIDDRNPQVMYATTKNGQNKGFCARNDFCGVLMKSTDGGASWFPSMECLDDDREYYMLIIHPENHDLLFVSTSKGVFASPDAGYTWVSINEGLPTLEHRIRDNVAQNLKITADGKSLILGLVDYGVWRADLTVLETELQVEFRRGDSNGDGEIDIADAVDLLFYLFLKDRTLACPDAADANDDRQIDIADPISLLSLLFGGAGDLPSPFPGCGSDPGQDLFAPCDYPHCPSF